MEKEYKEMKLRVIESEENPEGWTVIGEGNTWEIDLEKKIIVKTNSSEPSLPLVGFNEIRYFLEPLSIIPDLPTGIPEEVWKGLVCPSLENLYEAIPKRNLVVGKRYQGICRNADEAVWNGEQFEYRRYKFGSSYVEKINHYEDDDGYDLFVPTA